MNNPARSALLGAATAILLMSVGSLLTPGGLHAAEKQGTKTVKRVEAKAKSSKKSR